MPDTGNIGAESHCSAGMVQSGTRDVILLDFLNLWNSATPFAKILQTEEPIPTDMVWFCSSLSFFLKGPDAQRGRRGDL